MSWKSPFGNKTSLLTLFQVLQEWTESYYFLKRKIFFHLPFLLAGPVVLLLLLNDILDEEGEFLGHVPIFPDGSSIEVGDGGDVILISGNKMSEADLSYLAMLAVPYLRVTGRVKLLSWMGAVAEQLDCFLTEVTDAESESTCLEMSAATLREGQRPGLGERERDGGEAVRN